VISDGDRSCNSSLISTPTWK